LFVMELARIWMRPPAGLSRTAVQLGLILPAFMLMLPASAAAQQSAAAPASQATLTVAQAVQEALAHNRDLLAKRSDVPAAAAEIVTAGLRPNPVLSAGADHLDWLGSGFNDINNGGPTELSARVDVPVERGGKRDLRVQEAALNRTLAGAGVSDAERGLVETVQLACIDVQQATQNLALARETLRTFEDLAALNDERVRAGAAAPYEAVRTRVAVQQFRTTTSRAELDLRTASIRLEQLLGRPLSGDTLTIADALAAAAGPSPSLESLERLALDHRADHQAAKVTEARNLADVHLQEAQGIVDFTWGAEYRRQAGPTSYSNSLGVFFSAPLPLFSRNQGEIAAARVRAEQAAQQTAAVESAIRADVRAAFAEFQATAEMVAGIEHDLLEPARQARDIAAYTYRAGATTLVELIDGERAWIDANQSYHDAQADYRRAVAHLNAAVGTEVMR
jgi:cobalt-zinc-cadmium efflux system outer membrane protein